MKPFLYILCFAFGYLMTAQQEFHVFPINDAQSPGNASGDGTLANPWDLQTALNQKPNIVTSGDTIWLHKGIYNGRFKSTLQSQEPNQYITVSAFKNDKVILNGNVTAEQNSVLQVKSKQVIFKNFEVTWLGDFSRDENDSDFEASRGIEHLNGENCRFYNIVVNDIPGLGIGSWKHSAGTIIENCIIYNNGFTAKDGKGRGEGIYVQNKSEETRLIKNNIIFNNYYKGIEVWSAGKRADYQFVKNITLEGNIVFNSATPAGVHYDNVIVASNDNNGINVANNISLFNNILYHNTLPLNTRSMGDAPSLTFGFNANAPVENITADGNIIFGAHNAVRLSIARSLKFTNNIVYGGMTVGAKTSAHINNWNFRSNTFYIQKHVLVRVSGSRNYALKAWQKTFGLESGSKVNKYHEADIENVLQISRHSQAKNKYNLALFNDEGQDVTVDFSAENLKVGQTFTIYDVENREEVLSSGTLPEDFKITVPMQSTAFKKPSHNIKAKKTLSNFGVFIVEFDVSNSQDVIVEEKESALNRFFRWLGF